MDNIIKEESESALQLEFKKIKRRNKILLVFLIFFVCVAVFFFYDTIKIRDYDNRVIFSLNEGINTSLGDLESLNELILSNFSKILMERPTKVRPYFDKATLAQKYSDDLVKYIAKLRTQIIAYTIAGVRMKTTDIETWSLTETMSLISVCSKNNCIKPTEILIGSLIDGSGGEGITLKKKLEEFRKSMFNLFEIKSRDRDWVEKNTLLNLANEESYSCSKVEDWLDYHFKNNTLMADVAFLSKLIIDIKSIEKDVIVKLFNEIDSYDNRGFIKITPWVFPESNYIPAGSQYKARILLTAYNPNYTPDIYIGDTITHIGKLLDRTKYDNGMGLYSVYCSSPGKKKYTGWITIIKPGETEPTYYNFSGSYIVSDTNTAHSLK